MSKPKANTTPEVEEVVAEAKAEATPEVEEVVDPIAAHEAFMREEVEIELFYDGDKYKDDVIVGVNGKTWQIQRGVKVTVPRYVAKVIQNSLEQDKASAARQRELQTAFERDTKRLVGNE